MIEAGIGLIKAGAKNAGPVGEAFPGIDVVGTPGIESQKNLAEECESGRG
jgi:hypothetical protein